MKYQKTFLAFIVIALISTTAVQAQSAVAVRENVKELTFKLDSTAKAHAENPYIAGVSVAVFHKGDKLLVDGYGMANLAFNIPTPDNTIYEVGSITKQFTAAAILQLAENNSLNLDAPISDYIPEYNTRGHKVTVRHLLYHTSGIPTLFGRNAVFQRISPILTSHLSLGEPLPRDTLLSFYEGEPFSFAPGTAMSYNNLGYFMLGLIIERVSNKSFENYIEQNLLSPIGMDNSHICKNSKIRENGATGYIWNQKEGLIRSKNIAYHPKWVLGASSLCSSAGDLARWTHALHSSEVLSDSMYKEMIKPGQLADGTKLRYAMGLRHRSPEGYITIQHSGGLPGFLSHMRYYLEHELIIVVLQNTSAKTPANLPQIDKSLADSLATLVLGKGNVQETNRYSGSLSKFTGSYSGPAGDKILTLDIQQENGQLLVSKIGRDSKQVLEYLSRQKWRTKRTKSEEPSYYTFYQKADNIIELHLDTFHEYLVLRKIK